MQNISDLQKLAAINVLRHLLNSSGWFLKFLIVFSFIIFIVLSSSRSFRRGQSSAHYDGSEEIIGVRTTHFYQGLLVVFDFLL